MAGETPVDAEKICTVFDCDRETAARGMCLMHYKRARTAHNPSDKFTLLSFSDALDKDGPVPPHRPDLGPCWVWTGATNKAGYGKTPAKRFGTHLAHRIALTLHRGEELQGIVMHHCDNPPCCRPSHLKDATHAENSADASAKGRTRGGRADQTECVNGHRLAEGNVRYFKRPDGYTERKCIACKQEAGKRQAAQRKAARHARGLLRERKS